MTNERLRQGGMLVVGLVLLLLGYYAGGLLLFLGRTGAGILHAPLGHLLTRPPEFWLANAGAVVGSLLYLLLLRAALSHRRRVLRDKRTWR